MFVQALFLAVVVTFFSYETLNDVGNVTQIMTGWPFKWLTQNFEFDTAFPVLNVFDYTNISYRVDILLCNIITLYLFMFGIKGMTSE